MSVVFRLGGGCVFQERQRIGDEVRIGIVARVRPPAEQVVEFFHVLFGFGLPVLLRAAVYADAQQIILLKGNDIDAEARPAAVDIQAVLLEIPEQRLSYVFIQKSHTIDYATKNSCTLSVHEPLSFLLEKVISRFLLIRCPQDTEDDEHDEPREYSTSE